MSNEVVARETAKKLGLLDPSGELIVLDSLMIIDYATQLESETGVTIPTGELKDSSFSSLAEVAKLLARVGSSK